MILIEHLRDILTRSLFFPIVINLFDEEEKDDGQQRTAGERRQPSVVDLLDTDDEDVDEDDHGNDSDNDNAKDDIFKTNVIVWEQQSAGAQTRSYTRHTRQENELVLQAVKEYGTAWTRIHHEVFGLQHMPANIIKGMFKTMKDSFRRDRGQQLRLNGLFDLFSKCWARLCVSCKANILSNVWCSGSPKDCKSTQSRNVLYALSWTSYSISVPTGNVPVHVYCLF